MQVEGKDMMKIDTSHGKFKLLDNVQFVPNLGYTLLSVGRLMAGGYSILFDDNACIIQNKNQARRFISA